MEAERPIWAWVLLQMGRYGSGVPMLTPEVGGLEQSQTVAGGGAPVTRGGWPVLSLP